MEITKGRAAGAAHTNSRLTETDWNSINEPGCYLDIGSGDLFRISKDAIATGHSPLITKTSRGANRFVKLSDNPAEPISVAGRSPPTPTTS
jgi:hypothetical protein